MMMAKALPMRPSRAAVLVKQEQDDDSDTDEPNLLLKKTDSAEPQIIHSGHFMVSSPHSEHPPKKGYDFDTVNEQACQTYSGKSSTCHLSIDASLTKLLECMTLAYSGKLVSPKWKNFKGLKLQWRDKIRLNNAIWRAWYMQYIEKRQNPVCHFVTPLDASVYFDEHRRPEAIATEGKYWKRRIEIVVREYHKWRTYFKKRLHKHRDEDLSSLVKDDDDVGAAVPMEEEPLLDMEMLMAEISDTLFSTIYTHQHNPKEIAHAGNADMIQPELFPLQPNLDLMDTFESFPDLFSSSRLSTTFSSASTVPAVPLPDPTLHSCNQILSPPVLPSSSLSPVNLDEELIPSPGPPSILPRVPEVRRERASSVGSISAVHGPVKFNSETSINSQHGFVPVFPPPVTIFQTPAPPTVPSNPRLAPHPSFVSTDSEKFSMCNNSVITHTASATLTHNPSATTFSQSQNLILTTQQHVPCNISLQTAGVMQQNVPQPHRYFTLTSSGAKQKKQPPKILPAPQPETVSLLFAPASFPGQTQAVIVSPASLKTEAILAPRITQPNVVLAQAGLAGASGVPEFHGSILVGPPQQSQGSQKSQSAMSRLFSSPAQDSLVKREMTPSQNSSTVPSPSSCWDCQNSRQGSPCASEHSLSPPHSSGKNTSDHHSSTYKNERLKISAEQKRRFNIKIAFNTLNSFVSSSTKPISHAITLQKTVEYIAKLQQERAHVLEETRRLREEVEELNMAINSCQQQLPATGVPITPQRVNHMKDLFDKYVKSRTIQNWKFWIFSIIIKPLFDSFNDMVSTSNLEELYTTTLEWLDLHCSLPALRPMVLSTLRQLSTSTSILTDPSSLPEQANQAVIKNSKGAGGT